MHTEDYLDVVIKLFNRHAARGWNRTVLKRMILESREKNSPASLLHSARHQLSPGGHPQQPQQILDWGSTSNGSKTSFPKLI